MQQPELAPDKEQLQRLIYNWEPPETKACSACRHAVVFGHPDAPKVRCEANDAHEPLPLWRMLRAKAPKSFQPHKSCLSFVRSG